MAASDNTAAASAALRRLGSEDEAVLMAALSYMGREPFRRLRRAVGRTSTPLPSDDEGGSGPAGASLSSSFCLDPADNQANQVTAPHGANVNNMDAVSVTDPGVGAMASPTASHATQEPVWPPASGGLTSLDVYLASTNLGDTAHVMDGCGRHYFVLSPYSCRLLRLQRCLYYRGGGYARHRRRA